MQAKLASSLAWWFVLIVAALVLWLHQVLSLAGVRPLPVMGMGGPPQDERVLLKTYRPVLDDPEYVVTPRGSYVRYRIGNEYYFYQNGRLARHGPAYLPKL